MVIGRKFNVLTKSEYFHFIDNHKKYTDFNTLGLYRSLTENEKLSLEVQIEIRDYAHRFFGKAFNFLQLKDPVTYFNLSTLGREMTKGDERQAWGEIKESQQRILKEKRIKHRNFGDYSKHNCGVNHCPMDGLMIRQGSWFAESCIGFKTDKNRYSAKLKSERLRKERKGKDRIIKAELEEE